jgi:hypothetical protein
MLLYQPISPSETWTVPEPERVALDVHNMEQHFRFPNALDGVL